MSLKTWEELYRTIRRPSLPDTVTGFNMNLDRIIPVTARLLRSPLLSRPDLAELKNRLVHSMEYCTAGEWFVDDPDRYRQITRCFSRMGSCIIGGQAGIAALHLSRLGVNRVVCAAPCHGPESAAILKKAGVFLTGSAAPGPSADIVHHVFEYAPGLVPLAKGALPRNNRFIVSPVHEPSSVIVPEACMDRFLADVAPCSRAFLSGYQYLHTGEEFSLAVRAIAEMRAGNPLLRIHIEWVSAMDADVLDGCIRHILPHADSLGLNEHELLLLLRHLGLNVFPAGDNGMIILSPAQILRGAVALCQRLHLKRLHVHTFGYYVLVRAGDAGQSRNALLFAARELASAAGGAGTTISPDGMQALDKAEEIFGHASSPGIFAAGPFTVIVVPTLIAQGITRTTGLGDILSSTAFVADD